MSSTGPKRKRAEVSRTYDDDDDDYVDKASLKKKTRRGKKTAKQTKKKPFRFMSLPPELRNKIYGLVLVESKRNLTLVVKKDGRTLSRGEYILTPSLYNIKYQKPNDANHTALRPAFLRVNTEIRDEATSILYGQTLHFESPVVLHTFLARVGPVNAAKLRDIVLRGWVNWGTWRNSLFGAFSLLTSCVNLRSISMDRHTLNDNDAPARACPYVPRVCDDIRFWADWVDATRGKGTAKRILQFSAISFASTNEINAHAQAVNKRRQDFIDALGLND